MRRMNEMRRPAGDPARPKGLAPPTCEIADGGRLCRLRVWTEAEWGALREDQRPATREHVRGLGWVGAVPVLTLN